MNKKGVYCIVNLISKKRYIGSSRHLLLRRRQHFKELRGNYHANQHLQYSFNKYGEKAFLWGIIEYCDNYFERESYYIKKYDTINTGYNMIQTDKWGNCIIDKNVWSKKMKQYFRDNPEKAGRKTKATRDEIVRRNKTKYGDEVYRIIKNGKVIDSSPILKEIAIKYKLRYNKVTDVLTGRRKSHKGYTFDRGRV